MSETTENKRERVKEAYQALMQGDFDTFFRVLNFHPDGVLIEPDGLPYGGTYRGQAAVRQGLGWAFAAWQDGQFQIEDIAVSENRAYIYMHAAGQGKQTGKSWAFPVVNVLHFRHGQCVEFRPFYFDTVRAEESFGA